MGGSFKMSEAILASLISGSALVIVALLTFGFNRAQERKASWRATKLEYYEPLIDALAIIVAEDDAEAHCEFARASNNVHLIAPRPVLKALHAFRSHTMRPKDEVHLEKHNFLLAELLRAMRVDMGMPGASDIDGSHVQLWTTARPRSPMEKRNR